jgi:hypothetical protein
MWIHLTHADQDLEILYISYKKELASYHIKNYKQLIEDNPWFNSMREVSKAQGKAMFEWPNGKMHIVEPEGILSFKRGRHPHIVILDDVLADPTTMLDLGVIEKINQRVKEEVVSLPKEGGQIKVIGTAQTPVDFFFDLKENPDFAWGMFPAILNEKNKEVLWPQKFPYERLMHIRKYETGEKGFQKEFLIKPVWSANSYFSEGELMKCVNPKLNCLKPGEKLKTKNEVGAGWDIGKHSHPSHISVFEFIPLSKGMNLAV